MDVKYVHKVLLITWIRLFREPICLFNVCFRVYRKNKKKLVICTKRRILEVFSNSENDRKSTVIFNVKITPVIISMWITETVRRFQKLF